MSCLKFKSPNHAQIILPFSEVFSRFTRNERKVLLGLARAVTVEKPTGKKFMAYLKGTGTSSVNSIFDRFLDQGVILREDNDSGNYFYRMADPMFRMYLQKYKVI